MGQCSANLFQWHSSSKESLTGLLMEQIRNSQEEMYSENLQGQTQISDCCTGDDYVLSRKEARKQMALDNMNSSPERNKECNYSTTKFEERL